MNILVIGASGALGSVVTRTFLEKGARVAGVARTAPALADERFLGLAADTGSVAGVQRVLDAAVQSFGRVDAVVHLVGGFAAGPLVEETTDQELQRMLDLNLRSAWNVARVALPYFRAQGAGRFAAIASRIVEAPAPRTAAYAASKAALVAMMRTLDRETRDSGVRSGVLLPDTLDEAVMAQVTAELWEFVTS